MADRIADPERPACSTEALGRRDPARRGPPVFSYPNGKFVYWKLAKAPKSAFHMLGVLIRFVGSAVALSSKLKLSKDRRPTLAIALLEHMGDIVAAEPIARLARTSYPNHRIFWVTSRANRALIENFGTIDRVITVGCITEWMLLWRLGLIDVVWDLHVNDRLCNSCGIPLDKGDGLPRLGNYFEFGNILDVQCLSARIPRISAGPRIRIPSHLVSSVDALSIPARFIVIHGRSNDARKDWPIEKWRLLVNRILVTLDVAVVEVGLEPMALLPVSGGFRDLCGCLSVLETAEVIRRAVLFVGIDSGPAHLANAVSTPGVIMLGDYANFRHYMPYSGGYQTSARADLVYAPLTVSSLKVEIVFEAIQRRIAETRSSDTLVKGRPPNSDFSTSVSIAPETKA